MDKVQKYNSFSNVYVVVCIICFIFIIFSKFYSNLSYTCIQNFLEDRVHYFIYKMKPSCGTAWMQCNRFLYDETFS
jgi:hypothetical protein